MAYMRSLKKTGPGYAAREPARETGRPAGGGPGSAPVSNSILQAKLWDAQLQNVQLQRSGGKGQESESGPGREGGILDAGSETSRFMGASSARVLDPEINARIGGKLGADFSGVRIHTDEAAQRAADSMNARAFTNGRDIYFNEGEYNPGSPSGQKLLAHELTHTIQQGHVAQETDSGENVREGIPGEEEHTMAYAQAAQRGQTRKAQTDGGTRTASGRAQSPVGNSVMQAKLRVGASRTPAEEEADSVAARVMSGDSVRGSIPVTQGVSGGAALQGTVQRDFLGFKKRYRKAVDELNDDYEGYKQQSRWERFKWTVKNPIARMTARSKKNQQNTKDRLTREMAIEKMAMEAQANQANARTSIGELSDADRQSVLGNRAGGQNATSTFGEDMQAVGEAALDYGQKGADLTSAVGSDLGKLGEARKNEGMEALGGKIDGGASIVGGALGMVGSGLELKENLESAKQMELAGDKTSARIQKANAAASGISIGTSAASIAKGGLQLANMGAADTLDTVIPGVGLATSAIKGGAAVGELTRAGKVRSRTTEGENKYKDDKTEKGKSMRSLFHKGHKQAVNDQIAAGFDLASAGLEAAGNIASLSGAGAGVGIALSAAGTGLDVGKGFFMKRRHKKMVKSEVRKDLGITDELIKQTREQYQVNGKKLSRKEAEQFLLMKLSGSRSYEEAYLKNIREQKGDAGTEGISELKTALGVGTNGVTDDERKAEDSLLNQRLGVKEKDAGNLDASIERRHQKKGRKRWSNKARGEGTV